MSTSFAWVNGTLAPLDEAVVFVRDRGFQYGDGVFETMRTVEGRVAFLERHLARLTRGLAVLAIPDRGVLASVREGLGAVFGAFDPTRTLSVKAMVTRGLGPEGPTMRGGFAPTVVVTASHDERPRPEALRAVVARSVTRNERSALANVKATNYLESLLARGEAEAVNADEAIVLNTRSRVAEASAANVFAVVGGSLLTPAESEGCLAGIVRGAVVEIARERGFDVSVGTLNLHVLAGADEAFLTNSRIGVAALVELDGAPVGRGECGPLTRRLREAYEATERSTQPKAEETPCT